MLPAPLLNLLNNWVSANFFILSEVGYKPFQSPIVPGEFVISAKRRLTAPFSGLPEIIVKELFHTSMVVAAEFSKNPHADELRLTAFLSFVDNKFIAEVTQAESDMLKRTNPDGFFD